jgi:hypothetical protein
MELCESFTGFYETIADDCRISITHISLYMALLNQIKLDQGRNPIIINREKIMKTAKISSRRTYNRCINQLHEYGYIRYNPSSNPFSKSEVYLKRL